MKIITLNIIIFFSATLHAVTITNESIKNHFAPKAESKIVHEIEFKNEVKCSKSFKIIELIQKSKLNELAAYISWPLRRKFPLPELTKKEFLSNTNAIIDSNFLKGITKAKEINDTCMIANGIGWARTDQFGGKLFTLNYLSIDAKILFTKLERKFKQFLPHNFNDAYGILSCKIGKNEYRVFNQNAKNRYLLQVIKRGKLTDFITNGKRIMKGKSPLYSFTEDKTTLGITRTLQGYNLSLTNQTKNKNYICK
jgi:hypothetical protein